MMKKWFVFFMLVLLFISVGTVFGMASTHYRLDWFTLLDSGGGNSSQSTHYALNVTLGQSFIGSGHSTNYGTSLGYWASPDNSTRQENLVYLPAILK